MARREPEVRGESEPQKAWRHTREITTKVYAGPKGGKAVAHLLLGEWVKPVEDIAGAEGRIKVRYRGGTGYIDGPKLLGPRCLEIYFIDVGSGDSILIQTPEDRRILIDGGKSTDALAFIKNKYRLDKRGNYIDFDAVVCTHVDGDHAGGVIHVLKHNKIAVRAFYHSGLFRYKDKKVDPGPHAGGAVGGLVDDPRGRNGMKELIVRLADALDAADANLKRLAALGDDDPHLKEVQKRIGDDPTLRLQRLDASLGFVPGFDGGNDPRRIKIEILWPRARAADGGLVYPWYGDGGRTVNGNSVVLRVVYGRTTVLLSGDLNRAAMAHLLASFPGNRDLTADIYKAAHHGSQDFLPEFLARIAPNAGVISSGDDQDDIYGHPRAVLMGSIVRNSRHPRPAVFSTELAACYSPLSKKELRSFKKCEGQLYEKSIEGIVHFRCAAEPGEPDRFVVGTVYNKKELEAKDESGPKNATKKTKKKRPRFFWKWDVWPDPREEGPGD
jgi:beta-lactamase superfamily II metal-dependent hydrolase